MSASPIETALRACPSISEAVVFGASRSALGVIALAASAEATVQEVLERVHTVNRSNPSYARIMDELVIILPWDSAPRISKTSKGSVIRPKTLLAFAQEIDDAYERLDSGEAHRIEPCVESTPKTAEDVKTYVRTVIARSLQQRQHLRTCGSGVVDIDDHDDLFNAGVDSVQAVFIRSSLQKVRSVVDIQSRCLIIDEVYLMT